MYQSFKNTKNNYYFIKHHLKDVLLASKPENIHIMILKIYT